MIVFRQRDLHKSRYRNHLFLKGRVTLRRAAFFRKWHGGMWEMFAELPFFVPSQNPWRERNSKAKSAILSWLLSASSLFLNMACAEKLPAEKIRFSTVGDIMSHQAQIDSAYDASCDCWKYDEVFADVKPIIEKADYAIGNLETTLPGDRSKYSGYPQFGTPDSLIDALKKAGFDMLALSNNHTIDKYRDGVLRTKKIVREKGLDVVGTYADEKEYAEGRIFLREIRGVRFAFLNYSYGTNGLPVPPGTFVNGFDISQIRREIALGRERADAVIVIYHYGTEYRRDPDMYQRYAVDLAFQEGADIVIGSHPHVLQPYEKRTVTDRYGDTKERLVIWSLGNFVSNQQKRHTDGGMIFEFTVEKNSDGKGLRISDLAYTPVWVHIDHTSGSPIFRVLPCRDYVALRRPGKGEKELLKVKGIPILMEERLHPPRFIPDTARKRMQQFYLDTLELLGELPVLHEEDRL